MIQARAFPSLPGSGRQDITVGAFSPHTIKPLLVTTKDLKNEKPNMTRKELAISITEKVGVSLRGAAEIVDTVFATMKSALVAGESVKLVQFGVLAVRDKSPRRGRNPKTGASMTITKRQ